MPHHTPHASQAFITSSPDPLATFAQRPARAASRASATFVLRLTTARLARAGLLGVLSLSLLLPACGKRPEQEAVAVDMSAAPAMAMAASADVMADVAGVTGEPIGHREAKQAGGKRLESDSAGSASVPQKRYVAVRHALQIEAPGAEVAKAWTNVRDACARLDCELIASELQRETAQVPVSASLTMRVAPKDYAALTQAMGGAAKVVNDSATSEDKTTQVIDVEAHIKNRGDYRDSLRELLADKSVKRTLSELFEIRDTLSQVQAEIDSALTQRKLLEQETSKEFVQMRFSAERGTATPTHYSPWRELWRDSVGLLAESARALVQVLAVALPWLLLAAVLAWPLRAWLRRRARQQAAQQRADAVAAQAQAAPVSLVSTEGGASIE